MRRTNGGEVGPAAGGPNVRTGRALTFEVGYIIMAAATAKEHQSHEAP
jgi:hypothetical protein